MAASIISVSTMSPEIRKISFTGNRSPLAVASANQSYGPSPLSVQSAAADRATRTINQSRIPATSVMFLPSTAVNPSHTFLAPGDLPTRFNVTLTVTDSGGYPPRRDSSFPLTTPPLWSHYQPGRCSLYSQGGLTTNNLIATVSDAESGNGQLRYEWQTLLHHNDHNHGNPVDTNDVTTSSFRRPRATE